MSNHTFRVKTKTHARQWEKVLGFTPSEIVVLDHNSYMKHRAAIEAIRPPVKEVKPIGRPKGSKGKRNRKKDTISLYPEHWKKLDDIGPSRGKAVQTLIEKDEE